MNRLPPSGQREVVGEVRTDAAVIEDSLQEPDCFAVIFDRYFRSIARYLTRRVGAGLAEDLAAEVFAVAFASRGRYDVARTDARPWLFGIAANLLRHHHRSERRQWLAYARTGIDPLDDGGLDRAADRVDATASAPLLARALAAMPARDREALLLFVWAELSYDEVAHALGIPVGTVRSRLSRARYRLRRELGPGSGQQPDGQVIWNGEANG
ncbi:MAG: RNA polymerase sigma factor [Actinomycetota bacterium]